MSGSRALVLGGGGVVGASWEAGLMDGLRAAGVAVDEADTVIGTSAGALVGACMRTPAASIDVFTAVDRFRRVLGSGHAGALTALKSLMTNGGVEAVRDSTAQIVSEQNYLGVMAVLEGRPWPDGFRCVVTNVDTGEQEVLDRASGVDVHRAVTASCSVPLICPPITAGGRRWVDGGLEDMLNAGLAVGHDRVLVVSCYPLTRADPSNEAVLNGLDGLRATVGKVVTVEPGADLLALAGPDGINVLDGRLASAAYAAGRKTGAGQADRIAMVWARSGRSTPSRRR
nr:patatin-like phospholipase family protein [Catenuloplanes japonicus]